MTRREFIKSLLRYAMITGLYPVLSYEEALALGKKEIKGADAYITGCMWCQAGCTMIVYIKNGKVVHLTGNPEDPVTKGKICLKPFGSLEILNSPQRLKYPLKRIGDKFVRISWETALDEIAESLKKIKEKYGPETLGIWASGRSAFDGRLINKAFARMYGTANWEKTGPFCNYSAKIAGISTVGTKHTPWIYEDDDFYNANLYIFVGSNIAITRRPIFLNLLERKYKNQCKIVCVDPRKTETAEYSDLWLPIRPGTDMALALGMIYYILKNNLEDKKFISEKTEGFEEFKKELFERGYDVNWASRITGLPKKEIEYLARLYATTPKAIIVGNSGLSHHTNAVQTHRCFYFLAAITGHFCRPATGYACLNNGSIKIGKIPLPKDRLPPLKPALGKNPVMWLESLENPEYPYKLRALISTGSPLTQWPEQKKIRKYISQLELSVWNGIVPSINMYYFKYILPAATWIEAGGIAPVSDDSRFAYVPKLISPPGEAKPDRWWWIELAKRMGWEDIFKDEWKDHKKLIDFACGRYGFSVEDFLKEKDTHALRAPRNRKTLFLNGKFHTKDKKFHFLSFSAKFKAQGLSSFPEFYKDPDIAEKGEKTIKYSSKLIISPFEKKPCLAKVVEIITKKDESPYVLDLISGRPSSTIMGDASHWSELLVKYAKDQVCIIHPETAKKFEIKSKQRVKVISPYGEAECLAVVSKGIRRDTVFVPYSYGEKQPFASWKSINFTTNLKALCPLSGQVAFNGVKVKIIPAGS